VLFADFHRLMHFLNALGHDVEIRIRKPCLKRAAGIFATGSALPFPLSSPFAGTDP